MKRKQRRPEFELWLPIRFLTTIIITLRIIFDFQIYKITLILAVIFWLKIAPYQTRPIYENIRYIFFGTVR